MKKVKTGAFIVNTGRAELIHEAALVAAIRSGQVKTAALDIQYLVDTNTAMQLAAAGLVIHTGKTSWLSDDSASELRVTAAKELRKALTGKIPQDLRFCVNKEKLLAQSGSSNPSAPPLKSSFNALNGMNLPDCKFKYVLLNNIFLLSIQWTSNANKFWFIALS